MENNYLVPEYVNELLVASNNGLEGICKELSNLLAHPVIAIDPLFNHLTPALIDKKIEVTFIDDHYQNSAASAPSDIFKCQLIAEGSPIQGMASIILLDGRVRGYLIGICDEIPAEELLRMKAIFSFASSLCSLDFRKKLQLKKERQQFKEPFIYDLLYGNMKKKNEIISYGSIWGWDFNKPHVVIVFSIKDFDYYSEDKQVLDNLFYIIEKVLVERNLKPIAIKKRGEIVVIYPLQKGENTKARLEVKKFVSHVSNQVEKAIHSSRIAIGVGRASANPEDLFRSYQEAKVAFELGLLLNIQTPFFNDLGLERILYKHDLQDLKEYYHHTLGELAEYDSRQGSELMHTLELYSTNQYDLTKTAEAMFLHRNTLRYRFKKIEEIIDKKLDDMNVRLNITAALKIKQLGKI